MISYSLTARGHAHVDPEKEGEGAVGGLGGDLDDVVYDEEDEAGHGEEEEDEEVDEAGEDEDLPTRVLGAAD